MISFTKADLEAIALINPVTTANSNKINVEALIAKAHQERSEYIVGMFAAGFGHIKAAFGKVAALYRAKRQNQLAIEQLQTMSNRELADLGVARSEIKHAVLGEDAAHVPLVKKVSQSFAALLKRYHNQQNFRSGYAQLMAMDSRQLSDIGLTRGDIAAAVAGNALQANDNVVAPANNNGGRRVS